MSAGLPPIADIALGIEVPLFFQQRADEVIE
jgi:hypothetical protein